jgi:WD40 repeat protein
VTGEVAAEFDDVSQKQLHLFNPVGLKVDSGRYLSECDQFLLAEIGEQLVFCDHNGAELRRVRISAPGTIRGISATPDGRQFAAICALNGVYRIELFSPAGARTIPCQHLVHAAELTNDGRFLIYDQEKDILVVDAATGELVRTLVGHRSSIWRLALAPDGEHLASCSRDRTARIWNIRTGQEIWSEVAHAKETDAIAFTPDGETVATAGADGLLRLWRWKQGMLVFEYPLIDWPANRMSFSEDGRQLIVQAGERLRIYDASDSANREPDSAAGAPSQ